MCANCPGALNIAINVLAAAYLAISLLHVFWALGGKFGIVAAIPSSNGRFVFQPGRVVTLSVAVVIAGCSAMLYVWTGMLPLHLPHASLRVAVGLLGIVMIARAIGDFRYVGLFKVVRRSAFARMDQWFYTPFCVAAGVLLVASAAISE